MDGFEQQICSLGYGRREEMLVRRADDVPADYAFAAEIRRMFAPPDNDVGASAVFLHGGTPLACLVDRTHLPADNIDRKRALRRFCRRLWNQNLASVVLVLGGEEVEAYSVLNPDAEADVVPIADAVDDGQWSQADLSSGRVWERHGNWFDPTLRVDHSLLNNIVSLLKELCSVSGLSEDLARHSLARAIFVCFLEQRGIVGDQYRATNNVQTIAALIGRQDRAGLQKLFDQLRRDFNGDFLNATSEASTEFWALPDTAFASLDEFLKRTDLKSGQRSFWGYDFSEIPIELISGIYQTFIATKGRIGGGAASTSARVPTQRELGAFYTPRLLALHVVEQAFACIEDPLSQTVFDGACGSGILLTTAYRRLMRIAEKQEGRPLTFDMRRTLLRRCIFGGDVDLDACRLTAFSLYLALLSELDPSDLAHIQESGGKLPNLIGTNLRAGPDDGDIFSSGSVEATRGRFSMVISNPPWREPDAAELTSYERWLKSLPRPPSLSYRQIAIAYAFRALECLKPNGRLTLVLPVRLVVGDRALGFREELTTWMTIEQVVNFADLRRLVFPGAKHPFAVVTGKVRDSAGRSAIESGKVAAGEREVIQYLVPKADVALALGRLAVHADDRLKLPASTFYAAERLFGLLYWGTEHDVGLYRRCLRFGRLKDQTEPLNDRPQWLCNSGWVSAYKGYPGSPAGDLANIQFLDAADVPSSNVVLNESAALTPFPSEHHGMIAFFGERGLYRGPRVIWPDGVSAQAGIRAFFSAAPFTFRHSLKAIGGRAEDTALLQFLAAYLRSPLAHYFLILRSHTVAGERPKLHISDLLAMPFARPEQHPSPEVAERIVRQVSKIFQRISNSKSPDEAHSQCSGRLDELVFEYFQLSGDERVLVSEMVERVAPSIQPSSTDPSSLMTPLLQSPSEKDLEAYRTTLLKSLEAWRDGAGGRGEISVTVAYDTKQLLASAKVILGPASVGSPVFEARMDEVTSLLSDTLHEKIVSNDDLGMMSLPHLTVVVGRSVHILKPLRTRFWLRRAALADADRLVSQIRAATKAAQA